MEFTPVNVEGRKNLGIKTGDTVRVMQKIEEKEKVRLQPFEGLVIGIKHGKEPGATFTVRRVVGGYGVEKIFPLYSPMIDSISITKRSKVKRSKLYYIRETALKQIKKRMKMMFVDIQEEKVEETPETPEDATGETPEETPEKITEETPKEETPEVVETVEAPEEKLEETSEEQAPKEEVIEEKKEEQK